MKSIDRLAAELLLNGDEAGLQKLADSFKLALDVVQGRKCPYCGSDKVVTNDTTGYCEACDNTYNIDQEMYVNDDLTIDMNP
jgi:hypothetical protein